MEKTDPVFQLIDNYCRSYNKANKRKFIFTVITYHYFSRLLLLCIGTLV